MCARAQSRSVSSAFESAASAAVAVVALAAPDPVQLAERRRGVLGPGAVDRDRDDPLAALLGVADSAAQYSESSELRLTTKTKLSAASIESSMSCSHLEAAGMSSQSTQTSRPGAGQRRVQLAHERRRRGASTR